MNTGTIIVVASVGTLLLRALVNRKRPARVIEVDPISIVGTVPKASSSYPTVIDSTMGVTGTRKPLLVRFDVRISDIEKWAVSPQAVKQTVMANASDVLPGTGNPQVRVDDIETGYQVTVSYPDSYKSINESQVQTGIESVDPRLQDRIANVVVDRG